MRFKGDKNKPLYMISVVSKMLEVHPQTIRMYEREGFICPHRINKQRLYSEEDLETLNLVVQLTKELGVNKAGVDIILRMRQKILLLQKELIEVLNYLDEDVKREFQRRLSEIMKNNEGV